MGDGLLAFAYALGWLPLYLFRVESPREATGYYDATERWWIRFTVLALSVHISAACITLSLARPPVWSVVAGTGVFVAGVGLWLWGRAMIGPLRVRRLPGEPPLQLRRDGAFGIVRHPLYLGVLLAAGAPVLATGQAVLGITFVLCAGGVSVRAVQEERWLRAQLGEAYEAYCRQVKRLLPFVW